MTRRSDTPILFDADLRDLVDMRELVNICAEAIDQDAAGSLVAPARHAVNFDKGNIVFTTGGNSRLAGFRAYDTFPNSAQDQVVAVWDQTTTRLTGLIVGEQLGAYRTGAIGGVAIERLSDPAAEICAVIGTGLQARTQLMACTAVRSLQQVRVFSRQRSGRDDFAREMSESLNIDVVPTESASTAVAGASIIILATGSTSPVIDEADIAPDAHVTTIGPKLRSAHELQVSVADHAWRLVSDSPRQISDREADYFLDPATIERIEHLGTPSTVPAKRLGRTVFLSSGLAGTEVLVADCILRRAAD